MMDFNIYFFSTVAAVWDSKCQQYSSVFEIIPGLRVDRAVLRGCTTTKPTNHPSSSSKKCTRLPSHKQKHQVHSHVERPSCKRATVAASVQLPQNTYQNMSEWSRRRRWKRTSSFLSEHMAFFFPKTRRGGVRRSRCVSVQRRAAKLSMNYLVIYLADSWSTDRTTPWTLSTWKCRKIAKKKKKRISAQVNCLCCRLCVVFVVYDYFRALSPLDTDKWSCMLTDHVLIAILLSDLGITFILNVRVPCSVNPKCLYV